MSYTFGLFHGGGGGGGEGKNFENDGRGAPNRGWGGGGK